MKEMKVAWSYFVIHMMVEIVCFYQLFHVFNSLTLAFSAFLVYDFLAFVPQGFIGDLHHAYKKLDIGSIGVACMLASLFITQPILSLILLCIGNCALHEAGAISTVSVGKGKLFPSALFVSGGSFGVIIGQTLASKDFMIGCVLLLLCIEILVLFTNKEWLIVDIVYPEYHLTKDCGVLFVFMVALMVTAVRSYIGYAIPISWKKEAWQGFLLFFTMGFGKALGGLLSDRYGARSVGIYSSLLCIPFLVFGNNQMIISIIGVFIFSCTMSITFGMFMSIIDQNPGFAFGCTTVGLFIGCLPVFLFGMFGFIINSILVVSLSLLCAIGLYMTLK